MELFDQIEEAVQVIRKTSGIEPSIGILLGTGLGSLADRLTSPQRIPYEAIPHFPVSTVESHAGDLVVGYLAGKPVVVMSGRFHYYEGYSLKQVTFPLRVAKALGIQCLIISNAAGALNPLFKTGDLMIITDHINLMGDNPLIGPNDDRLGPRFCDMSEPYTKELIDLAESVAVQKNIPVRRGVYLACPGPCLETRAEYRFMRTIGADAVGMSTVPEVIVAVHSGLRVLGFSALTDECFPDALEPTDARSIISVAEQIAPRLTEVILSCIEQMTI